MATVVPGTVSTAAAANQDDDNDEPQAGTVIVSVVKAHVIVTSFQDFKTFYASGF